MTETTPAGRASYAAPALEKGLDILELLSARRDSLGLGQIAEALGRSRGEIFRMIAVLQRRGYIERLEGSDRYVASDKLARLGRLRPPVQGLIELGLPLMHGFSEDTRYPCHLAVQSLDQIVVVARVEAPDELGFNVRVGFRRSLLSSGSGLCLLAFMTGPRLARAQALLRQADPQFDPEAIEPVLAEARARGAVVRPSSVTQGVIDLSAPVLDPVEQGAAAALTVPYVAMATNPVPVDTVVARLSAAVAAISAALAGQGGSVAVGQD